MTTEPRGAIALLLLVVVICGANSAFDDPESVLYVSTAEDIRAIHPASGSSVIVVPGIKKALHVALDPIYGNLYWATGAGKDSTEAPAGIFYSSIRGSHGENTDTMRPLVTSGVGSVDGIAIDWLGRRLYFIDAELGRIVACQMDYGGPAECIIVLEQNQVDGVRWSGLALHPESRLMFWADASAGHIGSAGMDGSNRKILIKTSNMSPKTLVVDSGLRRIVWSDEKHGHIESCNFDGKDRKRERISTSANSIDTVKDTIYWSNPESGKIFSYDKTKSSIPRAIYGKASPTPYAIHVQHSSKHPELPDPCSSTPCSNDCLLSPASSSGFRCACPAGMELAADDSNCIDSSDHTSLLLANKWELFHFRRQPVGKDHLVELPNSGEHGVIVSIVYDSGSNSAVYSRFTETIDEYGGDLPSGIELYSNAIYSLNLHTKISKLLYKGIFGVNNNASIDIDVDPYSGDVYWIQGDSGSDKGSVVKGSPLGVKKTLIRNIPSPKAIALDPELKIIFIVTYGAIMSFSMDGKKREDIRKTGHEEGTNDVVYNSGFIYFPFGNELFQLERESVNGTGDFTRNLLNLKRRADQMAVGKHAVYWIQDSGVRFTNKKGPVVFPILSSGSGYSALAVVEKKSLAVVEKKPLNSKSTKFSAP